MDLPLPRPVREELNKAFGFLERDCPEKALRCIVRALRTIPHLPSLPLQKTCQERIQGFLDLFVRESRVRVLLENCVPAGRTPLPYRLGQEGSLAVVLEGLSRILEEQGRVTREAEDYAERRKRQDYLWKTGCDYLKEGQTLLAEAFFRRLLAEFPDNDRYWLEAGDALKKNGNLKEAARFFEAVVDLNPNLAAAYTAALEIYVGEGEYKKALNVCTRALRIFGEHPKTCTRMAELYSALGDNDQALEFVRRALVLDSTLPEARALEERLMHEKTEANGTTFAERSGP